jgi:hypothetical protein
VFFALKKKLNPWAVLKLSAALGFLFLNIMFFKSICKKRMLRVQVNRVALLSPFANVSDVIGIPLEK